jgi:beta-galactosidase/beta-glucuronidase
MFLRREKDMHPRPDYKREYFIPLDGKWDFAFGDTAKNGRTDTIRTSYSCDNKYSLNYCDIKNIINSSKQQINVPFVCQSEMSGVLTEEKHEFLIYKREIYFEDIDHNKRYLLNFGASDYFTVVFVNGNMAGTHSGGYSSFVFDITKLIKEEMNEICVCVFDEFENASNPRGKQKWTSQEEFGCFYKPYSGIWQSVWVDITGREYITNLRLTPDCDSKCVNTDISITGFENSLLEINIMFEGSMIKSETIVINSVNVSKSINIESSLFPWIGYGSWSPESPLLYDIELSLISNGDVIDKVTSYFGMRKIETRDGYILLNGVPVYLKMLLNQGYYPKGYITPADFKIFEEDVKLIKSMGFNGVRIHEKIENPLFLYECDRQGLLVWEELPSAYRYDMDSIQNLTREWIEIIRRDYNHPSIMTWVTMNESWGVSALRSNQAQQSFVRSLYFLTKSMDATRLVIGNDGWEHTETDIVTIHDYSPKGDDIVNNYAGLEYLQNSMIGPLHPRFVFADGFTYKGQPVIMSEFCGIAIEGTNGWGYDGKVKNCEEFALKIENLVTAIKSIPSFKGYCVTQFTDVEDEHNGILDFERNPKISVEQMERINMLPARWI